MKVSVIIPCFNVQDCVADAIASCNATQSGLDVEIICVDDKSNDQTVVVLEKLASSNKRIKIIRNEINKGQLEARRTGLLAATGDYVLFLDADDRFGANTIDALFSHTVKSPDDIVFFPFETMGATLEGERADEYLAFRNNYMSKFTGNQEVYCRTKYDAMNYTFSRSRKLVQSLWGKMFKRELVLQAHAFLPQGICYFAEDACVFISSISMANSVSYCKYALYRYNIASGLTAGLGKAHIDDKKLSQMLISHIYIKKFERKYRESYSNNTDYIRCLTFFVEDMYQYFGEIVSYYLNDPNAPTISDMPLELKGLLLEYMVDGWQKWRNDMNNVRCYITPGLKLYLSKLKLQALLEKDTFKKQEIKDLRARIKALVNANLNPFLWLPSEEI